MIIYTDGACQGNGKTNSKGGYGVVVCDDNGKLIDAYGHWETNTTNNIQELKAVLYAMIQYGNNPRSIPIVYTDSSYVHQTFTKWMYGWANNGWRKSDKKIPENLDLIQAYYNLVKKGYRIDLRKVAGHSGIKGNELADMIATGKTDPINLKKGVDMNG